MEEVDIIVADAEARTRAVLEVALRQRGYRVQGVSLATQIMPRVKAAPVSVIVVDASLGLSSIVALALQLREQGVDRPSLLTIAEISERDERIALVDAGVDEIVERPIYLRDVIARIEVLLARRQSRALLRGDMAGAGPLGTLGVMDLIHHLSGGGFTGSLHLQRRSMRAVLAFIDGSLVDARSEREAGMPVLVRALGWTEGSFRIEGGTPAVGATSLSGETAELLQEALGAQVRVQAARDSRIGPDRVLVVHYRAWTEHEDIYPTEAESLIRIFDGLRPVEDVIALAALPDEEGWKLVHQLLADGILHDVDRRPRPARPSRAELALSILELGRGQDAEHRAGLREALSPADSVPVSTSVPTSLTSSESRRRSTGPWRAIPDPADVDGFGRGLGGDPQEDWRTPALVDVRDSPPEEQGDTGPWRLAPAAGAGSAEPAEGEPASEGDEPAALDGQSAGETAPADDAGRTGPWHSTREEQLGVETREDKPSLDELAKAREVALSAGSAGAEWSVGTSSAVSGVSEGAERVIERTPPSAPRTAAGADPSTSPARAPERAHAPEKAPAPEASRAPESASLLAPDCKETPAVGVLAPIPWRRGHAPRPNSSPVSSPLPEEVKRTLAFTSPEATGPGVAPKPEPAAAPILEFEHVSDFESPEETGPGVAPEPTSQSSAPAALEPASDPVSPEARGPAPEPEPDRESPAEPELEPEPEPAYTAGAHEDHASPMEAEPEPASTASPVREPSLSPDVLASWYVGVEGEEEAQEWLTRPLPAVPAPLAEANEEEAVEWPPPALAAQRLSPLPILTVLALLALSVGYLVVTGGEAELEPAAGDSALAVAPAADSEGAAPAAALAEDVEPDRVAALGAASATRADAMQAALGTFEVPEEPTTAAGERDIDAPPASALQERSADAAAAPVPGDARGAYDGCRDASLAAARRQEACRQEIALSPRSVEAHLVLGSLLYDAGALSDALPVLEEAVRLSPRSAHAWLQLGSARQEQGELGGAREAYGRYLELVPGGPRAAEIRSVLEGLP